MVRPGNAKEKKDGNSLVREGREGFWGLNVNQNNGINSEISRARKGGEKRLGQKKDNERKGLKNHRASFGRGSREKKRSAREKKEQTRKGGTAWKGKNLS